MSLPASRTCFLTKLFWWLIVLASCLIVSGCGKRVSEGIGPGDLAPTFAARQLLNSNDKPLNFSDLKGRVVLLNFWASWCAPCVEELPVLEQLYQRYRERGLVIVGVGIDDSAERLLAVAERLKLTYPNYLATDAKVSGLYKIGGLPESLILDAQGRVAMIPDPQSGEPRTKLIGPRDWNSVPITTQIERLLVASP